MHVEIRVLRNFQLHVDLRIGTSGNVELEAGIISANVEIDMRVFHVALVPRLDRVSQMNLAGITAANAQVANVQPNVHHPTRGECARVGMRLIIVPVRSGSEWHQQHADNDCCVERGQTNAGRANGIDSTHTPPPERKGACLWYEREEIMVP